MTFYPGGVGVNFRFLIDRRTEYELRRLADLFREVPGAQRLLEGVEEREFRVYLNLPATDVLASDEALRIFKKAIAEAVQPSEAS